MATVLENIPDAANAVRNDRAEISPDAPAAPTRFAVREIGFYMVNGRLQFAFRTNDLAQPLPAGGIEAVVAALLNPPPAAMAFAGAAAAPPKTPLDLDVTGDPIYLVYMLAEPSNMRFSASLKAMTHKNSAHRPFYGWLRHVNDIQTSAQPLGDCKLIYLIAAPPDEDYRHGFNFNVELDQDPDPEGRPRFLPMEIDPDIRHPGGGSGT